MISAALRCSWLKMNLVSIDTLAKFNQISKLDLGLGRKTIFNLKKHIHLILNRLQTKRNFSGPLVQMLAKCAEDNMCMAGVNQKHLSRQKCSTILFGLRGCPKIQRKKDASHTLNFRVLIIQKLKASYMKTAPKREIIYVK